MCIIMLFYFIFVDIRRSAVGLTIYTCLLLPWMLTYWIGGAKLLGQSVYDKLDVTQLDLASAGLASG